MAKPLCALLVGVLIFAVAAVVGTQSSFTQESARFAGHSLLNSTPARMAPQPRSCTPRGLPARGPRCSAGDPALPRWGPRSSPAAVETKAERDRRMNWWREARFGMFIHWGFTLFLLENTKDSAQRESANGSWNGPTSR